MKSVAARPGSWRIAVMEIPSGRLTNHAVAIHREFTGSFLTNPVLRQTADGTGRLRHFLWLRTIENGSNCAVENAMEGFLNRLRGKIKPDQPCGWSGGSARRLRIAWLNRLSQVVKPQTRPIQPSSSTSAPSISSGVGFCSSPGSSFP